MSGANDITVLSTSPLLPGNAGPEGVAGWHFGAAGSNAAPWKQLQWVWDGLGAPPVILGSSHRGDVYVLQVGGGGHYSTFQMAFEKDISRKSLKKALKCDYRRTEYLFLKFFLSPFFLLVVRVRSQ